MPVDDLWYLKKRGGDGKPLPSKRYGRGKRWRCRWVDPETGEPRVELFEKKSDAERHDANVRADISRGQYVDPRAGKITVKDYAEQWRKDQIHDVSTAERVERSFRRHVYPLLGDNRLGAVRGAHIRAWVKDRSAELAPSSLGVMFVDLKAMFGDAVDDRVIGFNPCQGVTLPSVEREDRFVPSAEQVHAVAAELPSHYRAIAYVAAGCGLRPSEVFGLELGHVDFLRREVQIDQQLKRTKDRGIHVSKLKTQTSRRTVELPAVVSEVLAQHIETHLPEPVELDDWRDRRKPERRAARLLFASSTGRPLYRGLWSSAWKGAVRRSGLPTGFGLHGLRHYFATLLIHSGASVKTVQLALGHSTPTVTLNTYLHEWPDAIDRTRSLVDGALGAVPPVAKAQ
ncbi:tyrosine-type recombinase/integrase [Prauserella halophila]|uniref:Tyrosine-type recombinase/integrase n=1 Tax=Prauserella halophila TaxID=185641 RepID=A0ABP4GY63_9PSEU|nr:site-specific integrase [Prauserella halophila]MCP2234748.1 Site-specific recombinase XerD [Prauserella halophila]